MTSVFLIELQTHTVRIIKTASSYPQPAIGKLEMTVVSFFLLILVQMKVSDNSRRGWVTFRRMGKIWRLLWMHRGRKRVNCYNLPKR